MNRAAPQARRRARALLVLGAPQAYFRAPRHITNTHVRTRLGHDDGRRRRTERADAGAGAGAAAADLRCGPRARAGAVRARGRSGVPPAVRGAARGAGDPPSGAAPRGRRGAVRAPAAPLLIVAGAGIWLRSAPPWRPTQWHVVGAAVEVVGAALEVVVVDYYGSPLLLEGRIYFCGYLGID